MSIWQRSTLILSLLGASLSLSHCGYQLRGSGHDLQALAQTPVALISNQPNSPFIKRLRLALQQPPGKLVPGPDADIALVISDHLLWQNTRAVSANTQVRKHNLNLRVSYQFRRGDDTPITPVRELAIARSYSTDDNQMLGASHEKWQIEQALYQEMTVQLLNQLRTIITDTPSGDTPHVAHT